MPFSILKWLKPLYLLSKSVGLSPFRLRENLFHGNCQDIVENFQILQFVWPVVLFIVISSGLVSCVLHINLKSDNPGFIAHEFVVPLNYITALITLAVNLTVNRKKMQELMRMLYKIDSVLFLGKLEPWYRKARLFLTVQLVVLFLICIPYLCYDAYCWGVSLSKCVFEFIKRISIVIDLVVVMNFTNIMYFFKHRLQHINNELADAKSKNSPDFSSIKPHSCDLPEPTPLANVLGVPVIQRMRQITTSKNPSRQCNEIYSSDNLNRLRRKLLKGFSYTNRMRIKMNMRPSKVSAKVAVIYDNDRRHKFNAADILQKRMVYKYLYDTLKLINSIYGLPILSKLTFCFVGTVCYSYALLYGTFEDQELSMTFSHVFWFIVFFGSAISITAYSHMAQAESKRTIDEIQNYLLQDTVKPEVRRQLRLFSDQVSKNPIEFVALGFFSVNLPLLCCFIGHATTFIIILIQFKLNK